MDVFLYNSTVCRLCGEENDNGTLLYLSEENNQSLSEVVNTYLPIKVDDDGQLPRTICPGCTIQLEATVEFLTLIINGQKVIRELYNREKEYKRTLNPITEEEVVTDKIVYDVDLSDGVYQADHPISLQVAGLDKPKRKRGRPPKKPKTPEELAQEAAAKEAQLKAVNVEKKVEPTPSSGKRRRKTPTRFKEAVQGKELERIFIEEGVIDGEEIDQDVKPDIEVQAKTLAPREPEVIGHLEESGALVVVVKGKGRGRPKGPMRPIHKQCVICGKEFSCAGRYMNHVAQHGPVKYQCGECKTIFETLLDFNDHQKETSHSGQNVIPTVKKKEVVEAQEVVDIKEESNGPFLNKLEIVEVDRIIENTIATDSLPDLCTPTKEEDNIEAMDSVDVTSSPQHDVIVESSPIKESEVTTESEAIDTPPKGKVRLQCPQCDKTFSNKQSKSLHIKAAHLGEKPYICNECGAKFAYPRSLNLHKVSHRRARNNARGFACDLCGKVLNHPSSVVYHKEAEHAGQRYVCNKCGKCFKHKQLLQRHQLVHSQIRPFNCKICNSSFKTKANLLNHQLLHSGVKKFTCELCKQKFAHKTSLTLHMRWHNGQKPYSCSRCGKSFSQKGNLSEHLRIHTGEKPFQCSLCSRRFTTSSQHRLHARRHQHVASKRVVSLAPRVPRACTAPQRQCAACGAACVTRGALLRHTRTHHADAAGTDRRASGNKHKKLHKQVSLLAPQPPPPDPLQEPPGPPHAAPGPPHAAPGPPPPTEDEQDERVIYVTYDVDDDDTTAYHIVSEDQLEQMSRDKELSPLYRETSVSPLHVPLHVPPEVQHYEIDDQLLLPPDHMPVTDEQGNPLHFTMQDGTRLAITSSDGKSLQVITHDGQTIPVEINGFTEEEEELQNSETIIHQLDIQKDEDSDSPVTYFTIV